MTNIISKTRNLIQDNSTVVKDLFTYSTSTIFTLTEANPIAITDVLRNDVSVGYTFNSNNNKITLNSSAVAGDTIEVQYTTYQNWSDNEIVNFVDAALVHIANHNYEDFNIESGNNIYPEPSSREEKLIALITAMLMVPNIKRLALPDITITMPKKDDLSIEEAISNVIASFKRGGDSFHGIFEII